MICKGDVSSCAKGALQALGQRDFATPMPYALHQHRLPQNHTMIHPKLHHQCYTCRHARPMQLPHRIPDRTRQEHHPNPQGHLVPLPQQ